ncbi:hypothetical protein [Streptomyces sp. NPDC058240]|uniref:hypothetical protein n=1 Tax=Streptomyces sp. NPDC058240 TaxID=3346396 RepID=UPI0036E8DF80
MSPSQTASTATGQGADSGGQGVHVVAERWRHAIREHAVAPFEHIHACVQLRTGLDAALPHRVDGLDGPARQDQRVDPLAYVGGERPPHELCPVALGEAQYTVGERAQAGFTVGRRIGEPADVVEPPSGHAVRRVDAPQAALQQPLGVLRLSAQYGLRRGDRVGQRARRPRPVVAVRPRDVLAVAGPVGAR